MRKKNSVVLRFFGVVHLVFAAWGVYLISQLRFFGVEPDPPYAPYATEVFVVRTIINLVFLTVLVFAGIFLLRLRIQGVRVSNALFISMIVYFAAGVMLGGEGAIGMSIAATAGTGEMGTAPQMLTGYPIISLIVLNLARRKLLKQQSTKSNHA